MRKTAIFFLILLLPFRIPLVNSAPDEGYGEANENLGQFTDTFVNETYVALLSDVIVNMTLECVELNYTSTPSGWLIGWGKRVLITIDKDDIDNALNNFPVMIYLSSNSGINGDDITFIFDEIGSNSLKIAITLSDGITELFVEVDKWDSVVEEAWIWVNVSSIEAVSDTELYLYFDNSHADNVNFIGLTNSEIAEKVWDSNFMLVSHMRDNPDNTAVRDSTDWDNDGSKTGANQPILTSLGKLDDAQDFDGTNDRITFGNDAELNFERTDPFTISVWFNSTEDEAWQQLLGRQEFGGNWRGYSLYQAGTSRKMGFALVSVGGTSIEIIGNSIVYGDNSIHYFSVVYDGSSNANNVLLYLDGGIEGFIVNVNTLVGTTLTATPFTVADHAGNRFFKGKEDEIRISDIERNSSWIKAEYETGRDHLLDYGLETESGGYELDGYFLTEDYLNETQGNSLTLLTNASLPPSTGITVQFSSDKVTWVDNHGNAGSSTVRANFSALDLRDLNYSDIFMNYTFIGPGGEVTPRLYQSRIVTTEGTAGAGPGVTVIESDAPWIALAIILSIIAFLLATRIKR